MSQPRPFSLDCLSWHVFRFVMPSEYKRDFNGRFVRNRDERPEILEWCDAHIKGEWTWGGCKETNIRPIYVKEKADAMLLKLTWFDDIHKTTFS